MKLFRIDVMSIPNKDIRRDLFFKYIPFRLKLTYFFKNNYTSFLLYFFGIYISYIAICIPSFLETGFFSSYQTTSWILIFVPIIILAMLLLTWLVVSYFTDPKKYVFLIEDINFSRKPDHIIDVIWNLKRTLNIHRKKKAVFIIETSGGIDDYIAYKLELKRVSLMQNGSPILLLDALRAKVSNGIKMRTSAQYIAEDRDLWICVGDLWKEHEETAELSYNMWLYRFATSLSFRNLTTILDDFYKLFFVFKGQLYLPDFFLLCFLRLQHKGIYNFVLNEFDYTRQLFSGEITTRDTRFNRYVDFLENYKDDVSVISEKIYPKVSIYDLISELSSRKFIFLPGKSFTNNNSIAIGNPKYFRFYTFSFSDKTYKNNYLHTFDYSYFLVEVANRFVKTPELFFKHFVENAPWTQSGPFEKLTNDECINFLKKVVKLDPIFLGSETMHSNPVSAANLLLSKIYYSGAIMKPQKCLLKN